ncbi:TVP38/TMEM64 family protein [Falsibacillus albus]|uniref:TVP38/TMEM64 family membrane protein n=1 Tax=Falsibacillus albus TaxID=2478915 RepID=A0A3L7K6U8_9BACI|nr:TVP38/TMEM64 family protein [Falsibacillus albus]
MNEKLALLFSFVESGGIFAPVIFILFHILRQFLFIPVAVVCMAGGILFGSLLGTIYSLIGLFLLSCLFYFCIHKMPRTYKKLLQIKQKWFGHHAKLTVGQIAILKMVPFFHYHLLNLCLMERKPNFRDYAKSTFFSNIPLAFFYTVFGEFITRFTPSMVVMILLSMSVLFYLLREKVVTMTWREFFRSES